MVAAGFPHPRRVPRCSGRAADHGRRTGRRDLCRGADADPGRAVGALLSPAVLGVLLPRCAGQWPAAQRPGDCPHLVVTQLLPLRMGLLVHHEAPGFTRRVVRPVGLVANVLLLVLVGVVLVARETLAAVRLASGWVGMGLLLLASLGTGWSLGGPEMATRKALAITTATRNAAVGRW